MNNPIKVIEKIWRTGMISVVVMVMVVGGLFLNLRAVGATGDDSHLPSPSVSPSPTVSPTPTPTPAVSPSPSPEVQNAPSFPRCIDQTGIGDNAHYSSGLHQIVGNGLLEGQDDVYTLSNGNFLQCYVPPLKDVCIQTDWWRTDQVLAGWYSVNGSQWNLGNVHYLAKNLNYNCQPEPSPSPSPLPTPTPVVSPNPTPVVIINNNSQSQEQTQNNNQTVNVSVAGVTTGTVAVPVKTPETGVSVLGLTSMFGAGPVGLFLSKFGRGKAIAKKKEESLGGIANDLSKDRSKKVA